jgi:hypothetical protein
MNQSLGAPPPPPPPLPEPPPSEVDVELTVSEAGLLVTLPSALATATV